MAPSHELIDYSTRLHNHIALYHFGQGPSGIGPLGAILAIGGGRTGPRVPRDGSGNSNSSSSNPNVEGTSVVALALTFRFPYSLGRSPWIWFQLAMAGATFSQGARSFSHHLFPWFRYGFQSVFCSLAISIVGVGL